MLESLAAITIGISNIITSITINKFIFWFISLTLYVLLIIGAYEYFTNNFYFDRLNKKIDIIIKVDAQTKTDSKLQQLVKNEYSSVLNEISEIRSDKSIGINNSLRFSEKHRNSIYKFLSAWIIPILLILFSLNDSSQPKTNLILGALIFGIM